MVLKSAVTGIARKMEENQILETDLQKFRVAPQSVFYRALEILMHTGIL